MNSIRFSTPGKAPLTYQLDSEANTPHHHRHKPRQAEMKRALTSALLQIPRATPRLSPGITTFTRMSSTQPNPVSDINQHGTSTTSTGSRPALPAPEEKGEGDATKLDVSGEGSAVKLDHLGPLVVNHDGTMSRIGNWAEMSEAERKNTLRILGRRNQQRLAKLRGETGGGADTASSTGKGGK